MSKKVTLAEILGTKAHSLGGNVSLEHLPAILGDALPDLPRNKLGRHRLVRALKQRYGPNFRSLQGFGNIIKEFDGEIDLNDKISRMKAIKARG